MSIEKLRVNPGYFLRKHNIIEGKSILLVSSVHFRGQSIDIDFMRKHLPEEYEVANECVDNDILSGRIRRKSGSYEMNLQDIELLMQEATNLKWTFFFVCAPFWNNVKDEDQNKKVLCVAFSDSGVSVANHYRVMLKYDTEKQYQWIRERSVLSATKDGYRYPFNKEWKANLYVIDENDKKYVLKSDKATCISQIDTNMDMYSNYKRNMARYNSAMKHKFYYEAMLIDYALLEDVTYEFLFHIGVFSDRSSRKVFKNIKTPLLNVVNSTFPENKKWDAIRVDMISYKLSIIQAVAEWTDGVYEYDHEDKYLVELRKAMESCDIKLLIDTCEYIRWWLKYRNEIMHSMMKNNINSMDAEIQDIALEGMAYYKTLSGQKNVVKKGRIRKSVKL